MAIKLPVMFEGEGAGTAEMSWGQQTIWRGVEARGRPIWLTGVEELPGGTAVEDVAGLLAFLMGRYQSLRTRLRLRGDAPPEQTVFRSGQAWLEVIDADDDADPGKFARGVEAEWQDADLDYAAEWPVRMAVVRHRGAPAYRVIAMSHTTTDGFGVLAMLAAIAARDPAAGLLPPPVTAMEPLEQARLQGSPAGQRQSRAAERHWARVLATIPERRLGDSRDPRQPRYWDAVFDSPAAFLAIQAVAARTGVGTSPVLLAAFAVSLARVSGINPAVPRVMVSNRFRPRLGDTVSPITQTCPCVVDVAGVTFDEAVRRAYLASMAAYKNAWFEPARIRELVAAASRQRGADIDVELVYNDRRLATPREVTAAVPGQAQVSAALAGTTLTWETRSDTPSDTCHIHVRDSAGSVNVLVQFDTHYVAPHDVAAILRGAESVIVAAAADPAAPAGV